MGSAPWRWRTIEHTADLAIEVEAPSLEWLFLGGAHGMTGVLLGREDSAKPATAAERCTAWRELALEAPDREALLVDWLRELLYVQATEDLLFAGAEIYELEDTRLVGRVAFMSPPDAKDVERELKGVTYHDLELSQRAGGWFARVVFDL